MFERDYIMRIAKDFAKVFASLLVKLREDEETASVTLDGLSTSFVGLELSTLHSLSAHNLLTVLTTNGLLDINRAYAAGRILQADAEAQAKHGHEVLSVEIATKALHLLAQTAIGFDGFLNDEHEESLEQLLTILHPYRLETPHYERVVRAYKDAGRYDKAENLIFGLLETSTLPEAHAKDLAEGFYHDLLRRTDEELRRGGFSRAEVFEGIGELELPLPD